MGAFFGLVNPQHEDQPEFESENREKMKDCSKRLMMNRKVFVRVTNVIVLV